MKFSVKRSLDKSTFYYLNITIKDNFIFGLAIYPLFFTFAPQMNKTPENIYPIFDRLLQRTAKEKLLNQKAKALWLTGLSGSGKSTIAQKLEAILYKEGFKTQVLDGDNIRSGLNNNLDFTVEGRKENVRRIAEVSKLFVDSGLVTINCFISPTTEIRNFAKSIIGEEDFLEVFINAPLSVCEDRDVKGLYKKARSGEIKNFTGIDSPYEAPQNPALEIKTDNLSVDQSAQIIFDFILPLIKYS